MHSHTHNAFAHTHKTQNKTHTQKTYKHTKHTQTHQHTHTDLSREFNLSISFFSTRKEEGSVNKYEKENFGKTKEEKKEEEKKDE